MNCANVGMWSHPTIDLMIAGPHAGRRGDAGERRGWPIGHRRLSVSPLCASFNGYLDTSLPQWRVGLADIVRATVADFVTEQCGANLRGSNLGTAVDVLMPFLDGGKCLRSTFVHLGWMCGADADDAAVRAAASFELLRALALLQYDVMDAAPIRRGRPSAHMQFARWHRERALARSAQRFGESAAVLLGDLCLVWSEQMLRDSGLDDTAVAPLRRDAHRAGDRPVR